MGWYWRSRKCKRKTTTHIQHLNFKFNTLDEADMCILSQNFTKSLKNFKITEFHGYIWNRKEKCIKISTNMPGFGPGYMSNKLWNLMMSRKTLVKSVVFMKVLKRSLRSIIQEWTVAGLPGLQALYKGSLPKAIGKPSQLLMKTVSRYFCSRSAEIVDRRNCSNFELI